MNITLTIAALTVFTVGIIFYYTLTRYTSFLSGKTRNGVPNGIKYRIKRVKEELRDVGKDLEKAASDLQDIRPALQGKPRAGKYSGKKPLQKKNQ